MPESYIIQRFASEDAGMTAMWWSEYMSLPNEVKGNVDKAILSNQFHANKDGMTPMDDAEMSFLRHYDKIKRRSKRNKSGQACKVANLRLVGSFNNDILPKPTRRRRSSTLGGIGTLH